jgi:hypothetical protein
MRTFSDRITLKTLLIQYPVGSNEAGSFKLQVKYEGYNSVILF